MRINDNGIYRDMTPEEISFVENNYNIHISYKQLVESYIRERYTISDELAILRQRDIKSDEFEEYFSFCEECKNRAKKIIYEE